VYAYIYIGVAMEKIAIKTTPGRFEIIRAQAEKINKQALKLGCGGVTLTVGDVYYESDTCRDPHGITGAKRACVDVTIEGETPRIAGWQFVAALDHFYGVEAGTIIRSVPGIENPIPERYRDATANCDHCGLNRNRKSTYLLEQSGEWKQVGSTCLRDFSGVGFDPEALAGLAEDIILLMSEHDGYDGGGGYGGEYAWSVESILAYAIAHIRKDGFTSRKRSQEGLGRSATADDVASNLIDSRANMSDDTRKWYGERVPTDEDKAEALTVMEWMRGLGTNSNGLSDYEHNLTTIAKGGVVTLRYLGLVCSAPTSWARAMGKLIEQKQAAATSKHFGTVGQRTVFTLTCTRINFHDGNWGTTRIVGLVDADGNHAVWFSSKDPGIAVGETMKIKGTVKKHGDYKGIAQTVLSRCVVMKTIGVTEENEIEIARRLT